VGIVYFDMSMSLDGRVEGDGVVHIRFRAGD
jgi:hypothetical protein